MNRRQRSDLWRFDVLAGHASYGRQEQLFNDVVPARKARYASIVTVPSVADTVFTGCYTEGSGVKALQGNTFWSPNLMSPQFCQNGCNEMGYSLSGVENGNSECQVPFDGDAGEPLGQPLILCP
jgi:hypothetical protein